MTRNRITNRHPIRHAPIADALRETPGLELPVGTYSSRYSAKDTVRRIETADHITAYQPAGSFTARWEDADDGTTVYARYVGANTTTEDPQ